MASISGKVVSDLDIDNDKVVLTSEMSSYVGNAINEAIQNININETSLSDIVLAVISSNYAYVANILDGDDDGVATIDAGGAT